MKYLVAFTFAVVAAFCIGMSLGVSSYYGTKGLHDQLMLRQFVMKESSWWRWRTVTKDVKFPPPGYVNKRPIRAIYCIDQTGGRNTSTGYASLSEGGPGFTYVNIHLKSIGGGGLNFTVDIYG